MLLIVEIELNQKKQHNKKLNQFKKNSRERENQRKIMITYVNSSFGIRILLRVHGSALYKSVLPALISTIIYMSIVYTTDPVKMHGLFLHPYPMQALVTAFTFLLVFRANYSYNRWWEAYTAVYLMHSKWLDLATEIAAFHYQSKRYDAYKPPSFGANPGVQSLDARASKIMLLNNNSIKDNTDGVEFVPTNSVGDGGNVVGLVSGTVTGGDTMLTPTSSPTKQNNPNITPRPQGLIRHAKSPTMTDLMDQMDACEAEEAERNRQSLMSEELDASDDGGDESCIGMNEILTQTMNSVGQIETDRGVGGGGGGGEEASKNRRRSWLRKIRDKHSDAKLLRKSKKVEKDRRRVDVLPMNLDTALCRGYNNVNASRKQQKRSNQRGIIKSQPATARLHNRRKSITRTQGSARRLQEQLQFRDRFDVKTGKPYSTFTAVSRKHLRDGHLDPDEIPPLLFLEECAHLLSLMSAVAFSTLRNDLPEAESPLTVFEPGLPWPLVDPDGYRGRVRKGWTQSKSKFYSALQFALGRSRNDHARTLYNAARPFRVIGNVSDAEIEKLQEARGPLAKVSLVSMWLLELISREYQAGSTGAVAPPIISRLYQFVSEGLAGYNQARKIAYIPFPFPHAQITTLFMLVVDFLVTPLLMTTFVTDITLGLFLNLFSVLCFTGLHEVAREIENPFTNVPNDVPLNNYQAQFNEGLMVMFYGYHPDAYWDSKQHNSCIDSVKTTSNNQSSNEASYDAATTKSDNNSNPSQNQGENLSDKEITAIAGNGQLKNNEFDWDSSTLKSFSLQQQQQQQQPKNRNSVSFRIPKNEGVISIDEPIPESSRDELFRVPSGKSITEGDIVRTPNDASSSSIISNLSSSNNDVVDVRTTESNFFRVPLDSRMNSSSSMDSFRIVQPDNYNDSFVTLPTDQRGAASHSVVFRVPNTASDSSAVFPQIPQSEFNSSAIFLSESNEEDNNNNNDGTNSND